MRFRGRGVRAPCVTAVHESDKWESTVTSSAYRQDFQSNKGWVDGVS